MDFSQFTCFIIKVIEIKYEFLKFILIGSAAQNDKTNSIYKYLKVK